MTLKYFVSCVDQGVSTLGLTQTDAYNYFKNCIRSTAANWLDTFNRDDALEWEVIKPHFRQAFGDRTYTMVFTNTMFVIKFLAYNDNIYDYTNNNTKVLALHTDTFLPTTLH